MAQIFFLPISGRQKRWSFIGSKKPRIGIEPIIPLIYFHFLNFLELTMMTLKKSALIFKGGKIAYILQPGDTGYVDGKQHGLIAAEEDIKTIYTDAWDKASVTGYYRWSTGQYENENKSDYAFQALFNTSIQVGDGKDNTDKILAKYPAAAFPNTAAAVARAYRGGGYDDWFLPSQGELNQLYLNRSAVGGFVADGYWSSTEYDAGSAWAQDFGNGTQGYISKGSNGRVRPVRAF